MPRRVSMPGADELFRSTAKGRLASSNTVDTEQAPTAGDVAAGASGRAKHDEKMTVYLTVAELLAVEQARLELRGMLDRKVDRGRLVRAALSLALDDLAESGAESRIARRLNDS